MLCADAVVTDELTRLLTQHTQQHGRAEQLPGSIRILQNNQWNGTGFTGLMDGSRLRKLADQLVAYLHRSTQVLETATSRSNSQAPPQSAVAAAASPAAASPAAATTTTASATAATQPGVVLSQLDGAGGGAGDDEGAKRGAPRPRYADYSDEEDGLGNAGAGAASVDGDGHTLETGSELNSDDDDEDGGDDDDDDDDAEPSVVLCQFKPGSVKRSKMKWSCELQNGARPKTQSHLFSIYCSNTLRAIALPSLNLVFFTCARFRCDAFISPKPA
jgi:hypothetical protein